MTSRLDPYERPYSALHQMEQDERLDVAENFVERAEAIEWLEWEVLGASSPDADIASLMQRADALKQKLDATNDRLLSRLRAAIRANDHAPVRQVVCEVARQLPPLDDEPGYDALDILVNGLLAIDDAPEEVARREPELVFYQPTPARITLRLIEALHPAADDVFFDIGSGLGHVPILMHLLTGVRAVGIELEAGYCQSATACAQRLDLGGVTFVHADARHADLTGGTIYYLYTPFQGEVLRQVLGRLENEAVQRPIQVCAYGPCAMEVARQPWLQPLVWAGRGEAVFGVFGAVP